MTAFQSIMLFSVGAPLTPAGGSSWVEANSKQKIFSSVIYHLCNLSKYYVVFGLNTEYMFNLKCYIYDLEVRDRIQSRLVSTFA